MRIRYVPVSSAAALRRLRLQRQLSPSKSQVIRYRTRARTSPSINVIRANSSPRVNVIRANSSPKRQSAKSTRIQNRRKVTTNNIKQTIILAKTANIMSPVGGNQNNGPSAVVSNGHQSPRRSQPPPPHGAQLPPPPPAQPHQPAVPQTHPPAAIRNHLHHHLHLNSHPNHHQNVPQHNHLQSPVSQGHGHASGQGQGQGGQIQGHFRSGLPLGIGDGAQGNHMNHGLNSLGGHGNGQLIGAQIAGIGGGIEAGIGAGLGGGIGGGIGRGIVGGIEAGIGAGLGSGMGAGHGDLLSGLNVGIGGQLNAAQNAGLGGALGENIGPLNAILGGLTGFGNSNGGLNGGLNLGTKGQGSSHGHGNSPLDALTGNGNGLNGQAGADLVNTELIYQLLAGHSLNAMLEGQQTGALASLISSQNSAGKPSDILLQSLLGGNGHSINTIPNFSSLNSLLPGLRGSKAIDPGRVSSILKGRLTSLSPSFGVTQQPVVIKSNGGQLNIGLKKDPSTGRQNIVIQTAAAVMANEMMEAEPGEAP